MSEDPRIDVLEGLFKQHHRYLCNVAYNIVRDRDAAKDIVQEVFIKLWRKMGALTVDSSIKAYLFKSVTHTSINYLEKQKNIQKLSAGQLNVSVAVSADDSFGSLSVRELEVKIQQSIDRLPPRCKAIFLLSRHEGLKYKEIAEVLDVSIKTVENQMGIALERLRTDLGPYMTKEFLVFCLSLLALYLFGHVFIAYF